MARPTYDQLLDIIADKDRQIAELQARVQKLEQLLEKAAHGNKRQAAPFSKGEPKPNPKKPGRKQGKDYGRKARRPLPEQEPDEVIDVPLPEACGDCGGGIEETHVDRQFQIEIPRKPLVRRFDVHVGDCQRCGRHVRPRHELQTSDAVGAAASQLGPDVQALIALMKDKYGLSYGDICGLLEEAFGISISRGGAAHVVLRAAERAKPVHDGIREAVRHSDTVYPDETGWKVGGWLQWMWVFVTIHVTLYVIRPCRGHEVPEEVLGADYDGRMGHDGWSAYDFFKDATHQQCLAHLLRRAQRLLDSATRAAVIFPRKVKEFIADALDLRARKQLDEISPHGYAVLRGRLEARLDDILECHLSHDGNRTFQAHLARHRDELLTFLYEENLEATNWPSEQAIRPAVVNRKVFGGNRTSAGARAQEILGSVFTTCKQQTVHTLTFMSNLISSTDPARTDQVQQLLPQTVR